MLVGEGVGVIGFRVLFSWGWDNGEMYFNVLLELCGELIVVVNKFDVLVDVIVLVFFC